MQRAKHLSFLLAADTSVSIDASSRAPVLERIGAPRIDAHINS